MLKTDDISTWAESLDELKTEGYSPIKATTVLNFFANKGRTTALTASNIEPLPNLRYALYDPLVKLYYVKEYRGFDLDCIFFYRPTLTFSGDDASVERIRRWVQDGNVWVLMDASHVETITALLEREWKSRFNEEGKLDYRIYIGLLDRSLKYEDYKNYCKELTGFKTVCATYERSIKELWDKAYMKGKRNNKN